MDFIAALVIEPILGAVAGAAIAFAFMGKYVDYTTAKIQEKYEKLLDMLAGGKPAFKRRIEQTIKNELLLELSRARVAELEAKNASLKEQIAARQTALTPIKAVGENAAARISSDTPVLSATDAPLVAGATVVDSGREECDRLQRRVTELKRAVEERDRRIGRQSTRIERLEAQLHAPAINSSFHGLRRASVAPAFAEEPEDCSAEDIAPSVLWRINGKEVTVPLLQTLKDKDALKLWAETWLGDKVVLTKRALNEAADSNFEDVPLLCRALLLLGSRHDMVVGACLDSKEYYERKACELRIDYSLAPRRFPNDYIKQQYMVDWCKTRLFLNQELKKGTARDPRHTLRIYFAEVERPGGKCLVVGSMPRHLDNSLR